MNHIAWSVGRDVLLTPPPRGGRVLFFAGPHAEVDGRRARSCEQSASPRSEAAPMASEHRRKI
jgi:hypothetical protein